MPLLEEILNAWHEHLMSAMLIPLCRRTVTTCKQMLVVAHILLACSVLLTF